VIEPRGPELVAELVGQAFVLAEHDPCDDRVPLAEVGTQVATG
jgi:hypothetical protein